MRGGRAGEGEQRDYLPCQVDFQYPMTKSGSATSSGRSLAIAIMKRLADHVCRNLRVVILLSSFFFLLSHFLFLRLTSHFSSLLFK